jgi:acetate kinase
MLVLVVDAGSHSLRLSLVDADDHRVADRHLDVDPASEGARTALEEFLADPHVVGADIAAAGHRVVHGGPDIRAPAVVDDGVLVALRQAGQLAPQHMPAALAALDLLRSRLPGVPHAAQMLGRDPAGLSVVLAHLGGGASVCAVREGRSVWTSMGMTPLTGLVMATRSGDVDPGVLAWLHRQGGLTQDDLDDALRHRSSLLGLSGGRSADTRDLVRAAGSGDRAARLALDVFTWRARQGIAAAAACLPRLDAVVFTGEIGSDQPEVREDICAGLPVLGVAGGLRPVIDEDAVVSDGDAGVPVLVVETGEDL